MRVEIGRSMAARVAAYCRESGLPGILLVADGATWEASGRGVAEAVAASGVDVAACLLESPVAADEKALGQIALAEARAAPRGLAADKARLPIAVGSGTITDLVRFHAFRGGRPFVSVPTAASVDAYASSVSALLLDGAKTTLPAAQAEAVFADLEVLSAAPRPMSAAGFGDMVCKPSALADWRLGALVWGEPWDAGVAEAMRGAAEACMSRAPGLAAGDPGAVEVLFRALLASGQAMASCGHSRPASGAEHHLSHVWELRLHAEGRPPVLHGLKVGVATAMVASLWRAVAAMDRDEAAGRLGAHVPPRPEEDRASARAALGPAAEAALESQRRFLELGQTGWAGLKSSILDNWEEIASLASAVPGPGRVGALLSEAGCPVHPGDLGFGPADISAAWRGAPWLRDRFTILRLSRMLGIGPAGE